VTLLTRSWITAARASQVLGRRRRPREELVRRFAAGRSFADIGCMWGVDGAIAFLAEETGATSVTAVDLMPASRRFETERARRGSTVRFIQGDVHDEKVIGVIGRHDLVWCSGVLYHAPNPLLTLARLHAITGELLILATETIPEVPGLAQACVFLPGLSGADRRLHASARPGVNAAGLSAPFDRAQAYETWWWGMTRSAVRGMLHASGFDTLEEHGGPLHATFLVRPADRP
jgi:SAM-dependent methyltransferase